ncbi:hypothetical protein ACFVUS_29750 [Nocardia sp. NPDC058058]|uniref:Rv0361 family membrane protein n=1 Tax=Nocardia sp. NPDC058058 TaxID=3346317 RepID=UPI0036DC78C5
MRRLVTALTLITLSLPLAAGCTNGGDTDKASTTPASQILKSRDDRVDSTTREQIKSVTARTVDDYNNGNLRDLLEISCGQLKSELDPAQPDGFAAESAADLDARGRGSVADITDIKALNEFATAAVTLRYERHVEGLSPDNSIRFSGTYQKIGDTWHICGMN